MLKSSFLHSSMVLMAVCMFVLSIKESTYALPAEEESMSPTDLNNSEKGRNLNKSGGGDFV